MTQPPLSRALKQLEADLGTVLLHRTPTGVTPTTAGAALLVEARALLERADLLRARVAAAAGPPTLTVGTLADSAERTGTHLAVAFRERHPGVDVRIHEADFTDPTAGLRTGRTDVALTRAPFDDTGIDTHLLRTDAVGVVVRTDDPLARRDAVRTDDLDGRPWFQLPDGTDPMWRAYWQAATSTGELRAGGPVVRTVHECLQAVLWNATIGLSPLTDTLPDGLTCVPLTDMEPSRLVVAWRSGDPNPLVHSFARIAVARYGAP